MLTLFQCPGWLIAKYTSADDTIPPPSAEAARRCLKARNMTPCGLESDELLLRVACILEGGADAFSLLGAKDPTMEGVVDFLTYVRVTPTLYLEICLGIRLPENNTFQTHMSIFPP